MPPALVMRNVLACNQTAASGMEREREREREKERERERNRERRRDEETEGRNERERGAGMEGGVGKTESRGVLWLRTND